MGCRLARLLAVNNLGAMSCSLLPIPVLCFNNLDATGFLFFALVLHLPLLAAICDPRRPARARALGLGLDASAAQVGSAAADIHGYYDRKIYRDGMGSGKLVWVERDLRYREKKAISIYVGLGCTLMSLHVYKLQALQAARPIFLCCLLRAAQRLAARSLCGVIGCQPRDSASPRAALRRRAAPRPPSATQVPLKRRSSGARHSNYYYGSAPYCTIMLLHCALLIQSNLINARLTDDHF